MNACTFLLKPHHVLLQEARLAAYWHNHTDLELCLKGQRHFCSLTSHYVLSIYMFNTSFNLQEQRAIPTTYFHSISQNISKAVRVLFSNVLDYNLTRFPWEVDVMFFAFSPLPSLPVAFDRLTMVFFGICDGQPNTRRHNFTRHLKVIIPGRRCWGASTGTRWCRTWRTWKTLWLWAWCIREDSTWALF